MKIFTISNSFESFINHRKNLIIDLASNHDITIIANYDECLDEFKKLNIKYKLINIKGTSLNIFHDFIIFIKFLYIFYKLKPDLILNFTIKPNIYSSLAANILNIKNINNVTGIGRGFLNIFLKYILIILYYLSNRKTYRFFFQNSQDMKYFIKYKIANRNNSLLIPGSGVDLKFFYQTKYIQGDNLEIYYIGRVLFEKGIIEFLDLAKEISNKYTNINFNILGRFDNNSTKLKKTILNSKFVNYIGFKKDIRPELKKANLVILPSYSEGLPHVLLEAASMCKPIIASNIPGNKDVVLDGFNGYLFETKNIIDLKEKFQKFLTLSTKEREKMALNSRKLAEQKFDEALVINFYKDDISSLDVKNRPNNK